MIRKARKPPILLAGLALLAAAGAGRDDPPAADREAAARAFVREHHPELDALLETLAARNPDQYRQAIGDLSRTRETLEATRARDPARYELGLASWKARSRVERLAALADKDRTTESAAALRLAIAAQVDAELALRKYERDVLASRLKKLDDQISKTEAEREAVVETRYRRLARGRAGGKSAKVEKSGPAKDRPKGNDAP